MKKYFYSLIAFLVIQIASVSCSQDLLEIDQQGVTSLEQYYAYADDSETEALMADIYKTIYTNTGTDWITLWHNLSGDGLRTESLYSNIGVTAQTPEFTTYFSFFYRINYLCNLIIDKIEPNTDVKKYVTAEAHFWRAWAYIYLVNIWGNPPLVDHALSSDELKPPNASTEDLWNYIESSLNMAIENLPEKPSINGQNAIGGRVTKYSAYALLGFAQVTVKEDYSAATNTLKNIVNSNLYDLVPDYSNLWRPISDYCDEYMWEFNIEDNGSYITEGNIDYSVWLWWNSSYITMPDATQGGTGNASTFSKGFYDFMVARSEKGKNRYLGTIWDYDEVLDHYIEVSSDTSIITRDEADEAIWVTKTYPYCEGYFRAKYYSYTEDWIDPNIEDINYKISKANKPGMRYSEVLLLYAEACIQSGTNINEGLDALNKVRNRAGLESLTSYSLQDVKDEKRAEFATEGPQRYLDLIRWGDAPLILNNRGKSSFQFYGYKSTSDHTYNVTITPIDGATGFKEGRDELFPYPYSETLLNENLIQNPNW